jgi:hypothetical protein
MTFPGQLGYGAPTDQLTALVRRIEDLERTQRQTSTMLVDQGNIAVNDASGNRLITVGTGVAGLTAHDPGTGGALPLHALAFGGIAVETAATFAAAGNGVWRTDPLEPAITVTVSTGRLLVTVSAVQFSSFSVSNAVMSWTLTGPTAVAADNQRALVTCTAGYPAAGYSSGSYTFLHTGLAAGTYTVQSQYRCDQYGATADTFENRALIVQPY